jgi:hypothetical protein
MRCSFAACDAAAAVRCGWCDAVLCRRHRDRHLCAKEPTGQGRIWWPAVPAPRQL